MSHEILQGQALLNRREVLGLLTAAAATSLLGCNRGPGGPSGPYSQQIIAGCLVSPEQTEGPFFVDEQLNRSDIKIDPADGSISKGLPLRLVLQVNQVSNNSCVPLSGATVDVWHCDALGSYSDVRDNAGGSAADTRGKKFLRGYQTTDGSGKLSFKRSIPGGIKVATYTFTTRSALIPNRRWVTSSPLSYSLTKQ